MYSVSRAAAFSRLKIDSVPFKADVDQPDPVFAFAGDHLIRFPTLNLLIKNLIKRALFKKIAKNLIINMLI